MHVSFYSIEHEYIHSLVRVSLSHFCRYNTTYDLFEATNLAPEYPDVVSKLSAPLLAWVNDMPKSPKITYNAGYVTIITSAHVVSRAVRS